MSSSNFVVSAPRRCSARIEVRTPVPAAEKCLSAVRERFAVIKAIAPVLGVSEKAVSRKLTPGDQLHLSVNEFAAILRATDDPAAVGMLRGLAADAGKEAHLSISLPSADSRIADIARAFGFAVISDDAAVRKVAHHIEGRRARDYARGLLASAESFYRAGAEGFDPA